MYQLRLAMLCMVSLCALARPAFCVDRILVLPATSNNLVTVLDAGDLSTVGTVEAPSTAFDVLRSPDGKLFYIVARRGEDTITVVDSATLEVVDTVDVGVSPADAVLTPDGRYMLLSAGQLAVIDLETLAPTATIPVGNRPTRILVNDTSTRAFVLSGSGSLIAVVDLEGLQLDETIEVRGVSDIALSPSGDQLWAVQNQGIQIFRTIDLAEATIIPGRNDLINATLHPVPGTSRLVVQTSGVAPDNTAQLIDLDSGEARNIGPIGAAEFADVAVVNAERAYAILDATGELVEFDISSLDQVIELTSLGLLQNFRDIGLSPGGTALYASSLVDSSVIKINTDGNAVEQAVPSPLAPSGHAVVFAPSDLAPADMKLNGGAGQYFPPGGVLPTRLSVRITDRNGLPLAGVPVLFSDTSSHGFTFSPAQPTVTNSRGVASVRVTIPADPEPPPPDPDDPPDEEDPAATSPPIEPFQITAAAGGLTPVGFDVNIVRGAGLIVVSGNNQIVAQGEDFPLPLVLLATDISGRPLPPGTEILLAPFLAACDEVVGLVDTRGFVTTNCRGGRIQQGAGTFINGTLSASVPSFQEELGISLSFAVFKFSLATGANQINIVKLSGDNQTGETGTMLSSPLVFRVTSDFGASDGFGTEITQVSGPPVNFTPRRFVDLPGRTQEIFVTLGDNAGQSVLKVTTSAPRLPTIFFTMNATGGRPVTIQSSGGGQSGRILSSLPTPLRVQVINESGSSVPFPDVQWTVLGGGDATLEIVSDASGSNAIVTFGDTPGPIAIRATVATLQADFTVNATVPEPVSISTFSGQNQTLTSGVLSEPLVVQVNEQNNLPAAGAVVTFSGPPTVRLFPAGGAEPGNPVQVAAATNGTAAVRVELLTASALTEQGRPEQLSRTVTITASAGEQLSTAFILNVVGRRPEFESAGIVNAATFAGGIVPGGLASIFGQGLVEGIVGTESAGGATSFGGTTIRVGGIPAPLISLSAGETEQINFQVPFETAPGQTTVVEVENNGSRSTIANVPVFTVQPGIFEIPLQGGSTIAALLHAATGQLVTPENPADAGETVSLFYTGGGRLNPSTPTGVLGPVPPPIVTLPSLVGVDNKGADVIFNGYAPGFLGLYQANFAIPSDARCGLRPVTIRLGDTFAPNSTVAIRCP